mmetsp:Transcript_11105/g.23950  ORF Transcript_11105/g.23950 Transcript_11105/m.23950 type:complete len:214 (+) Transcript_11105:156-797(+)
MTKAWVSFRARSAWTRPRERPLKPVIEPSERVSFSPNSRSELVRRHGLHRANILICMTIPNWRHLCPPLDPRDGSGGRQSELSVRIVRETAKQVGKRNGTMSGKLRRSFDHSPTISMVAVALATVAANNNRGGLPSAIGRNMGQQGGCTMTEKKLSTKKPQSSVLWSEEGCMLRLRLWSPDQFRLDLLRVHGESRRSGSDLLRSADVWLKSSP